MRRSRLLVAAGVATGAAALPLALAAPAQADTTVNFTLSEMNDSGASGTATITATDDGSLHVTITGSGYIPNAPIPQHLHGTAHNQNFFCPPASVDKNGDGQVATEESAEMYGGLTLSLTTRGDTAPESGLALDRMAVADADGNLDYERTIPASAVPPGTVGNLAHMHVVQHGLDVNGNDKYDLAGLGESVFAKQLGIDGIPEELTNPATCGEATPAGAVETGGGSSDGSAQLPMFALGGLALTAAAGTFWLRRRFTGTP